MDLLTCLFYGSKNIPTLKIDDLLPNNQGQKFYYKNTLCFSF